LERGPGGKGAHCRKLDMENGRGDLRSSTQQSGPTSRVRGEVANNNEEHTEWALEVFNGRKEEELLREAEENILELDLGEDDDETLKQHLTMAVFYSRKSYNPKVLIA
jgi:hypothetical protein